MISSVSVSQGYAVLSGSSPSAQTDAAYQKQMTAREIAQEIAKLKAEMAALQPKDKLKTEEFDASTRDRQAEFDQELLAEKPISRTI